MPAPKWFQAAIIYQVYPRVHGYKAGRFGTLADIRADLPRIKWLGANTVWLMPVQPIGRLHCKGVSGCPYAIKDYKAVAPELVELVPGCPEADVDRLGRQQFRELVRAAHRLELRVVMDFVGNHCAPDNVLLDPANPPAKGGYHPEWFLWPADGTGVCPLPPCADWTDTADLNYGVKVPGKPNYDLLGYADDRVRREMWEYMLSVLEYWVREFDLDGYRCDFAHWVPSAFWREAISRLKRLKPEVVFFAEAYERLKELLASGFDAVYAFELYNQLKSLHHAIRYEDPYFEVQHIPAKIKYEESYYPPEYRLIRYTENHDEIRSVVMYGGIERSKPPFLLALTLPGIPMLYAGQESGEEVRPPLFEGDFGEQCFPELDFRQNPALLAWYRHVLAVRRERPSLNYGTIRFIEHDNRKMVVFYRAAAADLTLVMINFAFAGEGEGVTFNLPEAILAACYPAGGRLVELLAGQMAVRIGSHTVSQEVRLYLKPLQSAIFTLRAGG